MAPAYPARICTKAARSTGLKQLIVNADDFGYTAGINRAIVDAHHTGMVTSTSLMANGAAFEDAIEHARRTPGLDIGCHLNLVEGIPILPVQMTADVQTRSEAPTSE